MKDSESIDSRLAKTVFVVEATGCEQTELWERYHEKVTWVQDNPGRLVTVGYIKTVPANSTLWDMLNRKFESRPVCICLSWNLLNGKYVLFWYPTSSLVDNRMIEAWFKDNCTPPSYDHGRPANCNANNFVHCIHAILDNMV